MGEFDPQTHIKTHAGGPDQLNADNVCNVMKTVTSRQDVITLADHIADVRPDLEDIAEECADDVLTAWTS